MPLRIPAPSAIFVGRDEELGRVVQALARVPVAIICGVAGIGKSTLAFAIAERWGREVVYRRISDGEPLSVLIDEVRRALARGRAPDLYKDEDRMVDLAQRLDDAHALFVIDDLHRLDITARRSFIHGIGQLLRRGRLIATSRELPELGPGVDRLELRLNGLDHESAQALWAALDKLYEPAPGFDHAWGRAQGHPLLLRQAHAGTMEANPYAAALATMAPDERHVAGVLALANVRLSTTTLARLLPEGRSRAAVRRLGGCLLIDVHADGTCALPDLFREELLRTMTIEERARIHAELVHLLPDAELDVVTRVCEISRHLGELDRVEEVGQILIVHGAELVRHGATRELLRTLEAIPKPRRTPMVKIMHARALGRLLDLHAAHQALARLLDEGTQPRLEVLLGFAPIAMLMGRLVAAQHAFTEVSRQPDLAPWLRVRAQFGFGLVRTYQGHGDDGRAFLRRAIEHAESREAQGVLLAAEAFCFWLDERAAEAAEPLRRASMLLQDSSLTMHGRLLAPAALAVVLGRLGRFAEAEPWLRQMEQLLARSSDARSRIIYKAVLASIDYEKGARAKALAGLTEIAEAAEKSGDLLTSLWARTYIARLVLIMGRRRQALAQLDEISTRAHAFGVVSAVQAVERSRLLDPLAQLRTTSAPDEPSAKTGTAVRSRCLEALHAARDGDSLKVTALLDENAPLTTGADYAFDRALGHLARAVLARALGEGTLARSALADARREAQAGDADPELLVELDEALGRLRIVTGDRAQLRETYSDVAVPGSVVLDGRSHELRVDEHIHSLRRQPVIRKILYALAVRPGHVLSKEEVAGHLWNGRYDPMVHDNRLWANIRRLRLFLARSGLNIEFADDGYRLTVTHNFVFVEPLE